MTELPAVTPFVGRANELSELGALLEEAAGGAGQTVLLFGEGGVGKTRLADTVADRARKRGWTVAMGRAYSVETGVPYALFSDALLPLLGELDAAQLALMTRGSSAELAAIVPALAGSSASIERARSTGDADPAEHKARLHWSFGQFLSRLSAKQPFLLVVENLQWADASSLELFHFVARHIHKTARMLLVGTYNEAERDINPLLRTTEQSLIRLGAARILRIESLREAEVATLLQQTFSVDEAALDRFSALLYAWTRGNPFFIEETLKTLIEEGSLRQRDGRWFGWELERLELPSTVREVLSARLDRLPPDARSVANLAAVVGTRLSYDRLREVAGLSDDALVSAIEDLCQAHLLEERARTNVVAYDFTHPLIQQVLYGALGQTRARLLHGKVAEALESRYGAHAAEHADELAFHFARAHARTLEPKTVRYLAEAGERALARYANREAAQYLGAALEHIDRLEEVGERERLDVILALARARQRLGEYEAALGLWDRALASAREAGAAATELARIRHRMGLASYWLGQYDVALAHYAAALEDLDPHGDDPLAVRVRLARGICRQDLGRFDEAAQEVMSGLQVAERLGDPALLARVHRALLLMYAWNGSPALAAEHGAQAIAFAEKAGQPMLAWSGYWGMALLAGLYGDAAAVVKHLRSAEKVAEELGSPLLDLWTDELAIQYAAGVGDWEKGIATGESGIARARTLGQRALLPRLLVWTGLIYLERGEPIRAKEMFDEAWSISGAAGGGRPADVPSVVPAHLGMAAFHLATGAYREAVEIGEAGLALADSAGHSVWAVQWLLPLVAEARLRALDFEQAAAHAVRLCADAQRLGHRLATACAAACDGLLLLYRDKKMAEAARTLLTAAEQLEAIPYPYTAARIRRELARALNQLGRRDEATSELRRAHDVFARLGAAAQLAETRAELRALGARPPQKAMGTGAAGLTARELEIARMAALRKANKEIASALQISSRTVSTHLSNIFAKLGVESRGELADYVREKGLLEV